MAANSFTLAALRSRAATSGLLRKQSVIGASAALLSAMAAAHKAATRAPRIHGRHYFGRATPTSQQDLPKKATPLRILTESAVESPTSPPRSSEVVGGRIPYFPAAKFGSSWRSNPLLRPVGSPTLPGRK